MHAISGFSSFEHFNFRLVMLAVSAEKKIVPPPNEKENHIF